MFSSSKCNYPKLKTNLRLTVNRLKLMEKKKTELALKARKEIADYIQAGKEDRARIRVEHIVREDYMVEGMEILEMFCDLLLARFGIIESVATLDPSIEEAVASVIWCGPRLSTDVPELNVISKNLQARYGKEYHAACMANTLNNVNDKLMRKMSIYSPPKMLIENYMVEIARSYNVPFEPDTLALLGEDGGLAMGELINLGGNTKPGPPPGGPGSPGSFPPPGNPGYPPSGPPSGGPSFPNSGGSTPPPPPSGGGGGGGGMNYPPQTAMNYPPQTGMNYPPQTGMNYPASSSIMPPNVGMSQPPNPGMNYPPIGGQAVLPTGYPAANNQPAQVGMNTANTAQPPAGAVGGSRPDPPEYTEKPPNYSTLSLKNEAGRDNSEHAPPSAPDVTDFPSLPEIPRDDLNLPSVPSGNVNSSGAPGGNDIDFDDLASRFENLKKKK